MRCFVRTFVVGSVMALFASCGGDSENDSGQQSTTGGSSGAGGGSASGAGGGSSGSGTGASSSSGASGTGAVSGASGTDASGGAGDSGGTGAASGAGGAGGSSGSSGTSGSGGTSGAGGSSGSGGSSGTSGTGATSGSSGSSGTSGTGATSGSSGSSGAGGTSGEGSVECEVYDEHHGFVWCDELRWVYRASVQACDSSLPRPDTTCGTGSGACSTDADCTAEPHGYCTTTGEDLSCHCEYGCLQDSDCGPGQVCYCRNYLIGTCLPSNCVSDADCESGYHCASYEGFICGSVEGFACQSPGDECTDESDCEPFGGCQLGESNARVCGSCGIP